MGLASLLVSTDLSRRGFFHFGALVLVIVVAILLSLTKSSEANRLYSPGSNNISEQQKSEVQKSYGMIPMSLELNQVVVRDFSLCESV